jgi:hypothetical protein
VHDMVVALNDMFATQAKTERFNVSKAFLECKLAEGASRTTCNQNGWLRSKVGEARLPTGQRVVH